MEALVTRFVPVAFIEVVRDRLDKFVRNMRRRGLPEPVLSLGVIETRSACLRGHAHEPGCPVADWQEVTLSGMPPRFEGWRLVASVDNVDGKPVFRTVPGETVEPALYSNDPGFCDHCRVNRFRTEAFIIRNDDGRVMQVGRQCIRDFLGWDIDHIVRYFEGIGSMLDDDGDGSYGSFIRPTWLIDDILKVACDVVSVDGFYRKSIEPDSTKSVVFDIISPPRSTSDEDRREYVELCEKYSSNPSRSKAIYDATMAAVPTLDPNKSEWAYNLQTIMSSEHVIAKHIGILASAVILGLRAIDDQTRAAVEKRQPSEFVGRVGEKITITATLKDQKVVESYYGTSILYTFGSDGNIVKWFSSRDIGIETDVIYTVTGTVKKHDVYRDQKSTAITRAKVVAA